MKYSLSQQGDEYVLYFHGQYNPMQFKSKDIGELIDLMRGGFMIHNRQFNDLKTLRNKNQI